MYVAGQAADLINELRAEEAAPTNGGQPVAS
jgi:hypothetical protein